MDPQVQSSFIPKKSLDISATRSESSFGLLFLIALLVFITSLVAAGGSFAYTQYLNSAIASKSQSLALAEGAFDPGTIQDLVRLDSRLNQSKTLLASHVAVSGVFAFLSQQTLANVSFGNFEYDLNPDGTAKITMTGTADSFSTVALQSDQFGGNKLLKDVVFSGITVNTDGSVGFTVTANVDPSVLSYDSSLSTTGTTSTSMPSASPMMSASSTPATGATTPGQ
ncbi:MAG TPA: hypothetical protein VMR46_01670 [Candidatus Paceibacterota bacterium]|jgi:hypothetical protein|nr:hypothetical protein [Candidatus Paceibacterota bacterium]